MISKWNEFLSKGFFETGINKQTKIRKMYLDK